jgi:hypothetical protein
MKYVDNLKIILQEDNEIKRKFHPAFRTTLFGEGLDYLITKRRRVAEAFPPDMRSIIYTVLSSNLKLFDHPQDMPWYLDVIAQRIIDDRNVRGQYKIYIKACRDHWFFDVSYNDPTSNKRELLLSPFFHETPLPESTDDEEKVRGLADTFLFLSPLLTDLFKTPARGKDGKRIKIKDIITDAIDWCTIVLDAESIKQVGGAATLVDKEYELDVKATVEWDYSPIKEGKKSIPIYNSCDEEKRVIVSSKNVRKAIGDLSEAWHNPVAGSILLSAWTGSGKDVLQDILTYALSVSGIKTVPLASPQLGSSKQPLEELFTVIDELGFVNRVPSDDGRYELNTVPLLFLDEIHHDSAKNLRDQLLRVLEAKEMTSSKGIKINLEKARYLFAASETPNKLRTYNPPDFWTRIEYTIVMQHPLLLETRAEINETLRQFFCVFWRKAAKAQRAITMEKQTIKIIEYLCPNKDERVLDELSEVFANSLDSPLIPAISIRLLRAIINRLFSKAIYFMRTVKVDESEKLNRIKSQMDKWIIKAFNNIVPEIKPVGIF